MTNLKRNELIHLARLCVQEQGESEAGVKGEASLMVNLVRKARLAYVDSKIAELN